MTFETSEKFVPQLCIFFVRSYQIRKVKYGNILSLYRAPSFPALLHSSTKDGQNQETVSLTDGMYGISNSPIKQPFKKVSHGQQRFESVVEKFNNVTKRKTLIEELLLILKSETK